MTLNPWRTRFLKKNAWWFIIASKFNEKKRLLNVQFCNLLLFRLIRVLKKLTKQWTMLKIATKGQKTWKQRFKRCWRKLKVERHTKLISSYHCVTYFLVLVLWPSINIMCTLLCFEDLLSQLKNDGRGDSLPSDSLTKMLEKALGMVTEMKNRNFTSQKISAEKERDEAIKCKLFHADYPQHHQSSCYLAIRAVDYH